MVFCSLPKKCFKFYGEEIEYEDTSFFNHLNKYSETITFSEIKISMCEYENEIDFLFDLHIDDKFISIRSKDYIPKFKYFVQRNKNSNLYKIYFITSYFRSMKFMVTNLIKSWIIIRISNI